MPLVTVSLYITPAVTFGVFIATARKSGRHLDVANTFTSLSLISLLASPLSTMFQSMPNLAMTIACFGRIQKFLLEDEHKTTKPQLGVVNGSNLGYNSSAAVDVELEVLPSTTVKSTDGNAVIVLQNASFGTKEEGKPIIHDLDLHISRSSLAMIIGKVGSGKSTLLKGLVGELPNK